MTEYYRLLIMNDVWLFIKEILYYSFSISQKILFYKKQEEKIGGTSKGHAADLVLTAKKSYSFMGSSERETQRHTEVGEGVGRQDQREHVSTMMLPTYVILYQGHSQVSNNGTHHFTTANKYIPKFSKEIQYLKPSPQPL